MRPTSNAQHDQRYKSDADEQHYERDGVVFEPMPITGKHDVSSLLQMDCENRSAVARPKLRRSSAAVATSREGRRRQDKAGKSGTRDGAGDGGELENCYIDAGVKIKCRATIERVAPRQA